MESQTKACIINAGIGSWYPKGSARLKQSLIHHGFHWDIIIWNDWPNNNYDKSCTYNIKAAAFEQAIKAGYTHILWCDSSVWTIKDVTPIFELIESDGHFFMASGFNAAQTCSDKCLDYFGIDRNTAEGIPDSATGIMGINYGNPDAKFFIDEWIQAAKDGAFSGSRLHDNQSKDPRFLFHRQDQSAATCLLYKNGITIKNFFLHLTDRPSESKVAYYQSELPDNIILTLRGM